MTSQAVFTVALYVFALWRSPIRLPSTGAYRGSGAGARVRRHIRARHLPRFRRSDPAQDMPWTRYAVAVLLFNALGVLVVYSCSACSMAAVESAAPGECYRGLGLRYRRQFRHQYELAGLLRRIHDELFHADARTCRAEFLLGGHRHCGRLRPD